MIWEDLNENLIVPDLEAENSEEVFEKLGGLFIAEGYCRDTYVDALKEREKDVFKVVIKMRWKIVLRTNRKSQKIIRNMKCCFWGIHQRHMHISYINVSKH